MKKCFERYFFLYNYLAPAIAILIVVFILLSRFLPESLHVQITMPVVSVVLGSFYFIQKQRLDKLKMFHELFTQFNKQFSVLNKDLIDIRKQPDDWTPDDAALHLLYLYFDLCAEEYFFYKFGYIHLDAWEAWSQGMASYYKIAWIKELWDGLEPKDYYGFNPRKETERTKGDANHKFLPDVYYSGSSTPRSIPMNPHSITSQPAGPVPSDNLQRDLKIARPDTDATLPHIGLVGDTYTPLLTGEETDGRYCLIDMHIPPGGGPPPHRHDFEESFIILEGEIEATFRGKKTVVKTGETVSIPANAPHSFINAGSRPVRLLCICAPAGAEEFFKLIGVPVSDRTTPAPKLDKPAQAAFLAKARTLAPKYRTELLGP